MKKKLLLIIICIPVMMFAQQNGVTVDKLVVNAGTVTFNVKWDKAAMPKQVWSDTVWVWVDHNNHGVMERLPLVTSGATLTNTSPGGKVVTAPENATGVWVIGNARDAGAFSATVKLLATTVNLAGACAYASNYPPVGNYNSATNISFTGTPEYDIMIKKDIGGALELQKSASPFTVPAGYTVQSFTDKTGAPGALKNVIPATYTLSGSNGCAGATVALKLSGSQSGWRYQLRKNNTPVGTIIDGTGSALSFPDVLTAGNCSYTVWTVDNPTVLAQRAMQASNIHVITVQALPSTPEISVSASTVCQYAELTFRVTSPVPGVIYTWIGSTGTSNGSSYTFNTSNAGAKTATVYSQVTAGGLTCKSANAATVTANVQALPATPELALSASTVCTSAGDVQVAWVISPVPGATYMWSGYTGTPSGSSFSFNASITGGKTVTVYSQVTAGGVTCHSDIATVMALSQELPSRPKITASTVIVCKNTNVIFTASGSDGSTFTWTGDPAGTPSGTGSCSYTVSGATVGIKSVTAYARRTSGGVTCQSWGNVATVRAEVAPIPDVPTITASNVCQDSNLRFAASGTAGSTFTWSGNPAGTFSGTGRGTYTVNGATTGTRSVTAYAQLTSGLLGSTITCQSANAATVTASVVSRPSNPTLNVSSSTVCQNTNIIFTATGSPASTFVWSETAGTASGTGSCSYTVSGTATGTKTVSMYAKAATNGVTCLSKNTISSSAEVIPYPAITVQPTGTRICYMAAAATLSVTANNATAYQWMIDGSATTYGKGYTTSTYLISPSRSSTISVVVANGACSTTSNTALIPVTTAPDATVNFTAFDPCESAATGTVWYLTDTREANNIQTYKVKKLKDGHIWMVQDMKFGNKCVRTTFSGSMAAVQGLVSDEYPRFYGNCSNIRSAAVSTTRGYLYDWHAAMNASLGYYGGSHPIGCSGTASGTAGAAPAACLGICPKGWHVPTGGTDGEYGVLTGGTVNISPNSPSNLLYQDGFEADYTLYTNYEGKLETTYLVRYWSSTSYDKNDALTTTVTTSAQSPATRGQKRSGLALRCVRNY